MINSIKIMGIAILILIILALVYWIISFFYYEHKCNLPAIENGDCKKLQGYYYNSDMNSCEAAGGCENVKQPFQTDELEDCIKKCVK